MIQVNKYIPNEDQSNKLKKKIQTHHFDASDESLPANLIHTFHICRAMQLPM